MELSTESVIRYNRPLCDLVHSCNDGSATEEEMQEKEERVNRLKESYREKIQKMKE